MADVHTVEGDVSLMLRVCDSKHTGKDLLAS